VSPYLRTVKTSSGATAVQIVHSSHRGSRDIEHIGSAHDDVELELLKAAARQRLAAGRGVLDLGLDAGAPGGPLTIISSQMGCLVDALSRGYRVLGFDQATAGDEAFFQLVLARIIEPVSKLDSLRVLEEAGVTPAPYRTVTRRLRVFAEDSWRQQISAACAAHASLGPASLVLYDCSTLYFETEARCRRPAASCRASPASVAGRPARAGARIRGRGRRQVRSRDPPGECGCPRIHDTGALPPRLTYTPRRRPGESTTTGRSRSRCVS
jgi:hypothetical protein